MNLALGRKLGQKDSVARLPNLGNRNISKKSLPQGLTGCFDVTLEIAECL
jgi:hypothetical protein